MSIKFLSVSKQRPKHFKIRTKVPFPSMFSSWSRNENTCNHISLADASGRKACRSITRKTEKFSGPFPFPFSLVSREKKQKKRRGFYSAQQPILFPIRSLPKHTLKTTYKIIQRRKNKENKLQQ